MAARVPFCGLGSPVRPVCASWRGRRDPRGDTCSTLQSPCRALLFLRRWLLSTDALALIIAQIVWGI